MFFTSDNAAGVHPAILAAVGRAGEGPAMAYGSDPLTAAAEARIREVFEAPEARAYLVATGTAANSLALACICPPWATVYAHEVSHIENDECGGPEFFTGGAKLTLLGGPEAKIDPAALAHRLRFAAPYGVHNVQNGALSVTQATERGAVYSLAEVKALAAMAKAGGMRVHMDGTRFANAVARLGCTPAEASWKAGVDVLCLGATKNGAMAAEAVILFLIVLGLTLIQFGVSRQREE
jgi:threonine aldolase